MIRINWLVAALLLVGCGSGSDKPSGETWTENVKLSNGEILAVKRESRFGFGDAGQTGGPLTYSSLGFEYKGKNYFWESETSVPSLVEIDRSGRPVVAGSIVYEWALERRGYPCDRGVVEVYEGNAWIQIPSWEIDVNRRRNLAVDKARAAEGKALADTFGTGRKEVSYEWSRTNCQKSKEK